MKYTTESTTTQTASTKCQYNGKHADPLRMLLLHLSQQRSKIIMIDKPVKPIKTWKVQAHQ